MPECCCARCGKLLAAGAVACPDCAAPTPAAATLVVPPHDPAVTISQLLVAQGAPRAGVQLDAAAGAGRPAALAALAVEPGQRYGVGDILGGGAMGVIRDATDTNIRRHVAMKILRRKGPAQPTDVVRFIEEAQITGQLEHPNIVPVHELGVDADGNVFYTMKRVQGTTLKDLVKRLAAGDAATLRNYPLNHLLNLFLKVCDAVAFANARGVVHRDLKPDNIMVGDYGEVLVLDWGLAKIVGAPEAAAPLPLDAAGKPDWATAGIESSRHEDTTHRTMAGTIMGTPAYMSPEQAWGKVDETDARSDIYALGGILYVLLTLHLPVAGDSTNQVLLGKIEGHLLPPAHWQPERRPAAAGAVPVPLAHLPGGRIPESLAAVAMKALALKPADRYQTVKDLQAEIEAYQSGFATAAERASFGRQALLLAKRHKAVTTGLVAAALFVVVGLAALVGLARIQRQRAEAEAQRLDAQQLKAQAEKRQAEAEASRAKAALALQAEERRQQAEWLPVCAFDFSKETALEPRFDARFCERVQVTSPTRVVEDGRGRVALRDNRLILDGRYRDSRNGLAFLRWREPVSEDLRVEVVVEEGMTFGLAVAGDALDGYRAVFNTAECIADLDTVTNGVWHRLRTGTWTVPQAPTHRVRLEKSGNVLTVTVDGQPFLDYYALLPLAGAKHLTFAVSAFCWEARFLSIEAWRRRRPEVASVLDEGRGLLRRDHAAEAAAFFREELSRPGRLGVEARFLLGAALAQQGQTAAAVAAFLDAHQVAAGMAAADDEGRACRRIGGLALEQASRLLVAAGDYERGAALALQLIRDDPGSSIIADLTDASISVLRARAPPAAGHPAAEAAATPRVLKAIVMLSQSGRLPALELSGLGLLSLAGLEGLRAPTLSVKDNRLRDLRPLAGSRLTSLNCANNQLADLAPLRGLPLTELTCFGNQLADLSPLAGLPLTSLNCDNNQIAELTPLHGLPLAKLICNNNRIADLSPLRELPLTELACAGNQITDLGPLRGLPLAKLTCNNNRIADLSPLGELPLTELVCADNQIADLGPLRGLSLTSLDCGGNQITDLGPLHGVPLRALRFSGNRVTDLGPLRGLPLRTLRCTSNQITDLAPLHGLPLTSLACGGNRITDLAPLRGLPLTDLACAGNRITDLAPLRGLPLTTLDCAHNQIPDLAPLRGLPLTNLACGGNRITDLAPLRGLPLTNLACAGNQIADLAPLRGLPLTNLDCAGNQIADLAPLRGLPLTWLYCAGNQIADLAPLEGSPLAELTLTSLTLANAAIVASLPLRSLRLDLGDEAMPAVLRRLPNLKLINGYRYEYVLALADDLSAALRQRPADLQRHATRVGAKLLLAMPHGLPPAAAVALAERYGATLACPLAAAERTAVWGYVTAVCPGAAGYATAIRRDPATGTWQTLAGTPVPASAWATGAPPPPPVPDDTASWSASGLYPVSSQTPEAFILQWPAPPEPAPAGPEPPPAAGAAPAPP